MNIAGKTVEGVVAEKDGLFWGCQYKDGYSTCNDFGPIDKANISNSEFCTKPSDMTYEANASALDGAVLRTCKKTVNFEIG